MERPLSAYTHTLVYNEHMAKNYEAITCKVAIYTPDGGKVLVVEYTNNVGYGLPGGHLEQDEEPVVACVREVHEELGISMDVERLVLKNAWRHPDGKIILGYVSVMPEETMINMVDRNEIFAVHWAEIRDIESSAIPVGTYRHFILANLPVAAN